jgi:hypothetical protein
VHLMVDADMTLMGEKSEVFGDTGSFPVPV